MEPGLVQAVMQTLVERLDRPRTDTAVKVRRTSFESLVACLLSAQSRDANTARAADALFAVARTPTAVLALDEADIARLIKPCGLYNTKATNLKRLCAALLDDHAGRIPTCRAQLMALPGIGRKCADIMLRFVFDEPAIAVDTHVFRVATRIGLSMSRTAEDVARDLERVVPAAYKRDAHLLLLEHGKRVCRARRPRCEACGVVDVCAYATAKGSPLGNAREPQRRQR